MRNVWAAKSFGSIGASAAKRISCEVAHASFYEEIDQCQPSSALALELCDCLIHHNRVPSNLLAVTLYSSQIALDPYTTQ